MTHDPVHAPAVSVRGATPADLDDLVALELQAFSGDRMSRVQYRRHLANPRAAVLVVDVPGEGLLGSALVFFRAGSTLARLYSIATAPAARGRGLGGKLLAAAEGAARARGCRALRLEVRVDNTAAMALYERAGYRQIGRYPAYYEDRGDAWRYEKPLTPAGHSTP